MMKDFMLFLSHVFNLILATVFALAIGLAIGWYDIGGIASDIYADDEAVDNVHQKNKKKWTKTEKARKMGFHLED